MRRNKKAIEIAYSSLVIFFLVLLVGAVILVGFLRNNNIDKSKEYTSTGDNDNDGIPDVIDPEPCTEGSKDRSCLADASSKAASSQKS